MMDSTLINLWLQNLGNWLYHPMLFFTFLGYQQFYLLLIPIIYWCINPRLGVRLGAGLMLSASVNGILKLAFHSPRPYWIDQQIQALSTESSFGMPSGHAQNGIVFWGLLARGLHSFEVKVLIIPIVILIGISRLYLGVHFLGDVLVGWIIGAVGLWLMIKLERPFLSWFNRRAPAQQIALAFLGSLGIMAAVEAVRCGLRDWSVPAGWLSLSARSSDMIQIDPLGSGDYISAAATLFGLSAGVILLTRQGWLDPRGSFLKKTARSLFGLVGAFIIWYGLKQVFPEGEEWIPSLFRYLRYTLLGFWVSYLAPLTFYRFKLAAPEAAPIIHRQPTYPTRALTNHEK